MYKGSGFNQNVNGSGYGDNNSYGQTYNLAGQNTSDSTEFVEIHIKCEDLANEDGLFGASDGQCAIYIEEQDQQPPKPQQGALSSSSPPILEQTENPQKQPKKRFIGATELINDNANPEFNTPITVPFIFELRQKLTLVVFDVDGQSKEVLGEAEFDLSRLVAHSSAGGLTLEIKLDDKKRGIAKISCTRLGVERYQYYIDFKLKDVKSIEWFSKTDPFLILERPADSFFEAEDPRSITTWHFIHRTEFVDNDLNPNFKPFTISQNKLCKGREDVWIRAKIMDKNNGENSDIEVGVGFFRPQQLLTGQAGFKAYDADGGFAGEFVVEAFNKVRKYCLTDYLNNGLQLSMVVGIDFATHGGDSQSNQNLHFIPFSGHNKYEQAIIQVGSNLQHYDSDKKIGVFGYGFRSPQLGVEEVSFCYPLNGNFQAPFIYGFENIISSYRDFVPLMIPVGPKRMAPIMKEVVQLARRTFLKDKSVYHIFLILTDGVIHDKEQTLEWINMARELPLSVLIVGIGAQDMSQLQHLDDSHEANERDIVQFVHYDRYCHDQGLLNRELLKEIPKQVLDFYKRVNVFPN